MKTLANRDFCKKKLDTCFDTHCIKTGVQLWWRWGESNPRPKARLYGFLRAHLRFWDSPRRTPHSRLTATVASWLRVTSQSFDALVPHIADAGIHTCGQCGPTHGLRPRKTIRYCQLFFVPVDTRYRGRGSLTISSTTPVETSAPPCGAGAVNRPFCG